MLLSFRSQLRRLRQAWESLSAARYFCFWMPESGNSKGSLYTPAQRGALIEPQTWTETYQKAFETYETFLMSAIALALPDVSKDFPSVCPQTKDITKEVLTYSLGPRKSCCPTNGMKSRGAFLILWWHTPTQCCLRLLDKEETDGSNPKVDGGQQREIAFSQKQLVGLWDWPFSGYSPEIHRAELLRPARLL